MARAIAGSLGIDYIRAVISNIYGAGEKSPRLINTTIRKLLNGEHCAFSAGEQLYDFIYVTDAAKMFAALGDSGKSNKTYYIGDSIATYIPSSKIYILHSECTAKRSVNIS